VIVGLISDTHSLLRDSTLIALHGSGLIIHAGDVGDEMILQRLEKIAPVVAVRENIDTEQWAVERLPRTAATKAAETNLRAPRCKYSADRSASFGLCHGGQRAFAQAGSKH